SGSRRAIRSWSIRGLHSCHDTATQEASREEVAHAVYEATSLFRDDDMLTAADRLRERFVITRRTECDQR
ncbi:hypothetical protein, partial [Prauserella endophytica]|uniref:hypothetical protein n=1 Tax=Prauserella endophytica TaxID=1592324 RepID=UPI00197D62D4